MKPYGKYKLNVDNILSSAPDVQECQNFLLKGQRIRNKKAKRRIHNKTARQEANNKLRKEQDND